MASFDPLPLLETLCQCLDVAGSPNYYDLPVLENSLQCLLHLTARYISHDQCLCLQSTVALSLSWCCTALVWVGSPPLNG